MIDIDVIGANFQENLEQLRIAEREFIKNQVDGGVMEHYEPSPEMTIVGAMIRQTQEFKQSNEKHKEAMEFQSRCFTEIVRDC